MNRPLLILAVFALAACSKKEPPPSTAEAPPSAVPGSPAPVASAPGSAVAPSASVAATPDIPVEEDFEDEANEKVTAQSLDSQLDALEKEIKAN